MKNAGQFTKGQTLGKKNNRWKGDKVGYHGLHTWVQRQKGKPIICIDCGSTKNVEWVNISRKYKRDLKDWKSLCHVCHFGFDGMAKLTKHQAKIIKERLRLGEKQKVLAVEFGVDQATISNIKRRRINFYV